MTAHEELLKYHSLGLLDTLLLDRTTNRNIIWGTDTYADIGPDYAGDMEITPVLLLNGDFRLQTRTEKTEESRTYRQKARAEVFTPCSVVRLMNDAADELWFGRPDALSGEKIRFAREDGRRWRDYVAATCLEITCGEGPFLTTRYDASTGEEIPVRQRTGVLDRKLRAAAENTRTKNGWEKAALAACRSVYGYEFQGDSLLIARLNLMMTYEEHLREYWHSDPTPSIYKKVAEAVSWNCWQMDGLTGCLPYAVVPVLPDSDEEDFELDGQMSIGGFADCGPAADEAAATRSECLIRDWKSGGQILTYNSMRGGSRK